MKRSWIFLAFLVLAFPLISRPQTEQKQGAVNLSIRGANFEPIPILIPAPFIETPEAATSGAELRDVLTADLDYSGFFDILDSAGLAPYNGGQPNFKDWRTTRAKYVGVIKAGQSGDQVNVEARFYDLQSEQLIVGKVYRWDKKFVRQIAHRFGNEILTRLWGVKGIFTSKIAFSSDRTGKGDVRDVWLMDYDGYNQQQVTISKTLNLSPDLSPDGQKVVYTTYRTAEGRIGQTLVIYSIYSGQKFTLFGKGNLNSAPAWSPDGKRIAFTSDYKGPADIFTINADATDLRQLTFGRSIDTSPAWNPKTGQIAFTSDRSGNPMIYIMNDDGTHEQRLTWVGEYNESAAWSPDGRFLAYVSRSGNIFDIYVIDMESTVTTRLTQNEGSNENPYWSPDSMHICFASNRTGRYQIWSMLRDGTKLRQLTRDGSNTSPSWQAGE